MTGDEDGGEDGSAADADGADGRGAGSGAGGEDGTAADRGARYKVVPPARDVAFLRAAREALPLVPGSVEDCCSRIRDRTAVPSRDEARETLTFLQALGLAAESERGFHRTRTDRDEAALRSAFRERVFGAREVLDALADGPRTVDDAFEALRPLVPRWERDRRDDWEAVWRERTERLLGWAAALGLAERDGDRYRPAESGTDA